MIGIFGCQNETIQPKEYPYVITEEATYVNNSGVTLNATLLDPGKEEIIDYGFVLYEQNFFGSENHESNFSIKNETSINNFTLRISSDLDNGRTYGYGAYVKTRNHVVLGNIVSFESLGSEAFVISDFFPKMGSDGTRVKLIGKNFSSHNGRNKVFVNDVPAVVIASNPDSIIFTIPLSNIVGEASIRVEVGTQKIVASSKFNVLGPTITSISSLRGHSGDQFALLGDNLTSNGESIYVFFESYQAKIISMTNTKIEVIIPVPVNEIMRDFNASIKLTNGLKSTTFENKFQFIKMWEKKQSIPVTGRLHSFSHNQKGYVLQDQLYEYNPRNDTWTNIESSKFLGEKFNGGLLVMIGEKLYKMGGYRDNFSIIDEVWVYDFTNKSWERGENIPFSIMRAGSFIHDEHLYIITSFKEVWKYDLINKTYQKMSDFPRVTGQADIPVLIIQKDNKIYANLDSYFFEYNPLSDSWNETGQTPMTPFAFYVNEIPYIGSMYLVSSLYRITESGDLIHTSNYPIAADSKIPHPLFQIDGKAYIVLKDQWSDYLDKAVYGSSFYMLTK